MKLSIINISLFHIFFSILLFSQSDNSFYTAFNSISALAINNHLQILAHDSLEGRSVGTRGSNIAAGYISDQYSKYGLKKITSENSYFQNIPMHGSIPLNNSEFMIIAGEDTSYLKYSKDYFLYRSGQQTFLPTPLPLVFVGYGIVAPEFDYNDYQSVDVEGKIVVYIDSEPSSDDEDYFDGKYPTVYSYPESKRRIAISRGASGTIQIPLNYFEGWEKIQNDFEFEDVTLAYSVSSSLSLLLNPDKVEKLFEGSDYSFNDISEMHNNNRIESFPLSTKLKFKGAFKERDFISPNVIGMVQGSDPNLKDTYLIISAHYDHLGIGKPVNNDSIYNGALDNAIGVSSLLELARAFSILELKPKRSIIFIATTGEEKGLLGSSYYTDNPVVPLYKTIANVNIDGIAMFRDLESIVAIGSELSTLENWLSSTADKYQLELQSIPPQFKNVDAFNKSDQLAFALAGIPSILVLEGTKNKSKTEEQVLEAFIDYFLNYYHTPFDDLNQNIDSEAAAKHTKVIFDFCFNLANSIDTPEWKQGSQFINARLRSIAEKK
jgi:hypothetical protein